MNVKELEELVLSLQKKLDRATVEISRLKAENAMLKEKLAKYESKRRNNSKNTSQPPSRDQKSEPAETEPVEGNGKTVSQYNGRQPSDRPVGGQRGHKGKALSKEEIQTLIETNRVSHDIVYHGYAQNLEDYIIRYELAVDVSTKVIEHRFASIYLVPERYHSDVVYDASVKGIATMLHAGHHVALDRVSNVSITQCLLSNEMTCEEYHGTDDAKDTEHFRGSLISRQAVSRKGLNLAYTQKGRNPKFVTVIECHSATQKAVEENYVKKLHFSQDGKITLDLQTGDNKK